MLAVRLLQEGVVGDSLLEWLTVFTFGAGGLTWYRSSRCHRSDCRNRLGMRRRGKYPHGHLRLCHVHHPHVPNDGHITAEHVDATTRRLGEKERPHA